MKQVANRMVARTMLRLHPSLDAGARANDLAINDWSYVVAEGNWGPASTDWYLTGMVPASPGHIVDVENATGFAMSLLAEDAHSTAANRLRTSKVVADGTCVRLLYSGVLSRWISTV